MNAREDGIYNILDFGADPSGATDSTTAIQKAIDAAAGYKGQGGVVLVPPGIYLSGQLTMRRHVTLKGCGTWGYKTSGSCILQLNGSDNNVCLVDMTQAFSSTVEDLVLRGNGEEGPLVHGIYIHYDKLGGEGGLKEENLPTVRNCKAEYFSGDGLHFYNVWCSRIIDSQMRKCRNGLFLRGVDCFMLNCFLSSNQNWGLYTDQEAGNNSAVVITACRVEWNRKGGFYITGAKDWQIANCSFDRNFGPAIHCASNHNRRCMHSHSISITGNLFNRNGVEAEGDNNSHLILEEVYNVTTTGNTFCAGANDDYTGGVYPEYCVVAKELKSVIVANNVMHNGCTKQLLLDYGAHFEGENMDFVYRDNLGCPTSPSCYVIKGYYVSQKN